MSRVDRLSRAQPEIADDGGDPAPPPISALPLSLRYQTEYFPDAERSEVKLDDDGDGAGNKESGRGRQDSDVLDNERFAFVTKVVRDYITDGAPNEINIR